MNHFKENLYRRKRDTGRIEGEITNFEAEKCTDGGFRRQQLESKEATVKRLLEIKDPREAQIAITTSKNLDLAEISQVLKRYMEIHNVTLAEMAYYPNGEQVLKPEMFQEDED